MEQMEQMGVINSGYRTYTYFFIRFFFLKKGKKGDSTFQLEFEVGLVGIMQAGMWEF